MQALEKWHQIDEAKQRERRLIQYEAYAHELSAKQIKSVFTPKKDTAAKKLARVVVYQKVSDIFKQRDRGYDKQEQEKRTCLFLAGRTPDHEVKLARKFFDCAQAIDVDRRAIDAVKTAGGEGFLLDIADLRYSNKSYKDAYAITHPDFLHDYDFVNLDLCGLVTSTDVDYAVNRAFKIGSLVATWFSYGHEDMSSIESSWSWQKKLMEVHGETTFSRMPETIAKRVVYLWRRAHMWGQSPGNIVHVFSYKSNAMPMMVILWSSCWADAEPGPVIPFTKISTADYRGEVLRAAEQLSRQEAADLYGCTAQQISAWKAVRTRQILVK